MPVQQCLRNLLKVCLVPLVLIGCSEKESLKGVRESVLSSDVVGEHIENIDKSPVLVDAEVYNRVYMQPFMNSAHCYAPLKFAIITDPQEIWTAGLDFEATKSIKITASPIVADGKVFCIDAGGVVYAFDAETGEQLWRKSSTIAGKDGQTGTAIAYDKGHLIVATCFSEAMSLNPKTGALQWRIKLPASSKGDAITISEGRVFFMCANSSLQVVDIDNGKLLWSHSGIASESAYLGSSAVAVDGGMVYVAYPSGEIFALLVETGATIWESAFPKFSVSNAASAFTHPKASPVVKDGIVYFVAANEQTAAFDAKTGTRLWIKDYGGLQTPIVSGNSIFVINARSEMVCLNRFTGDLRWRSVLDDQHKNDWYGTVLLKDRILALSPAGEMLFISLKDGKITRTGINVGSRGISVNPIIADTTLYILSNDGDLSAYKSAYKE